jgi:hypothetical protein
MTQIVISDDRMDELIERAKRAAIRISGGGDGSPLREHFSDEVYRVTLDRLIANEREEKSSQ